MERQRSADYFEVRRTSALMERPLLADTVAKVEKSNNPRILAKADLRTFLLLRRFSASLGRSVIDFG
jgi:hypothetical protein